MTPKLTKKSAEYILRLMNQTGVLDRVAAVVKFACYHHSVRVIRYRLILDNNEQINSMKDWNDYKTSEPHFKEIDYLLSEDVNEIFRRPRHLRVLR